MGGEISIEQCYKWRSLYTGHYFRAGNPNHMIRWHKWHNMPEAVPSRG
jgi:hypothetical protein